jgi:hypothetical protein
LLENPVKSGVHGKSEYHSELNGTDQSLSKESIAS